MAKTYSKLDSKKSRGRYKTERDQIGTPLGETFRGVPPRDKMFVYAPLLKFVLLDCTPSKQLEPFN